MNENKTMCAACGGRCCKGLPGCCWPQDFELYDSNSSPEKLLAALRSGRYSIDWWEDLVIDKYWVRPKVHIHPIFGDDEAPLFHGGWPTGCILLGPEGCMLSWNDRPYECRALVPHNDRCFLDPDYGIGDNPKLAAAEAWAPFLQLLLDCGYQVREEQWDRDPHRLVVEAV